MAKLLGIGIATLDIINTVSHYPQEDQEVRCLSQSLQRGGNVTNTLVVLSQMGHDCFWAGTLADEPDTKFIRSDLDRYNINTDYVRHFQNGKVPTSYISLSVENGSRTIVHHRDLAELDFEWFNKIPLDDFNWLHFEGRNIEQTLLMLQAVKMQRPELPISIEIEKQRDDIENLIPYASVVMFSKHYCHQNNIKEPVLFLKQQSALHPEITFSLTWGDQGSYGYVPGATDIIHIPAIKLENIVDSIGAGDTFNAGLIHQLAQNLPLEQALLFANEIAAYKLKQHGFAINDFSTR